MAERAAPAAAPRVNILVVEDDEGMRQLLNLHLSNAGYVVTLCEDAIAAGHRILKFSPDLIVLDVDLPYFGGLDFAATLLADATVPQVPIIFITANEEFAPKAEMLGADFIVKPFPRERLLDSVARNIRAC
jgi:DNA-binding response OmpR family regulator